MKVEMEKYYRSATGTKEGPMDGGPFKWIVGRGAPAAPEWENDGTPRNAAAQDIGALIAEWVDEPQIEVGKTYPDQAGRKWECLFIRDDVAFMQFGGAGDAYRYKLDGTPISFGSNDEWTIDLGPVRGEVVLYGRSVFGVAQVKSDTHKLTLPTLDGKPAVGTYTGENGLSVKIEEVE